MASSAVKRLQKDLRDFRKNPIPNSGVEPSEDNFLIWYVNILGAKTTSYEGVLIRIMLEFSEDYPNKAPLGYFITDISYEGGAQYKDYLGRISICLDIFGNFAGFHDEWKKSAGGWSTACTVETIIVQIQAAVIDLFSKDPNDIMKAKKSALSYICKETGHDGSDQKKWIPQIFSIEDSKKEEETPKKEGEDSKKEEEISVEKLSIKNSEFWCFSDHISLEDGAIFGYGISIVKDNISVSPYPISFSAFGSGIRSDPLNKNFEFIIPIYINNDHWKKVGKQLAKGIDSIRKTKSRFVIEEDNRMDVPAFSILASSMNDLVIEIWSDSQLTAYF